MTRHSLQRKIGFGIFGALSCIFLLEAFFRLDEFRCSLEIDKVTPPPAAGKQTVIICLGESITAGGPGAYPALLEEELRHRLPSRNIRVLNQGMAGATSFDIASRLKEKIEEYRPDLVVIMMGVNDTTATDIHGVGKEHPIKTFFRLSKVSQLAKNFAWSIRAWYVKKIISGLTVIEQLTLSERRVQGPLPPRRRLFPINPHTTEDYIALGDWYLTQDRWKEAALFYSEALVLAPNSCPALARLGVCYWENEQWEPAERLLTAAIEADPRDPEGYIEKGNVCQGRRQWEEAGKWYREAIRCAPAEPRAYREWGMALVGQGMFELAEKMSRKALSLDPSAPESWAVLGFCYRKWGRLNLAQEAYEIVFSLRPNESGGLLQTYIEGGKTDLAADLQEGREEQLLYSAQEAPPILAPRVELAELYRREGREAEAEKTLYEGEDFYRRALEKNPKGWWLEAELARFRWHRKRFKEAEDGLERAIELRGDIWWLYTELGRYRGESGRMEEADCLYRAAAEINPGSWEIYQDWGILYFSREDWAKAESVYREWLKHCPEDYRAYVNLALTLIRRGVTEEANKLLARADVLNSRFHSPFTADNYLKIQAMLDENDIRLVAVQYPMIEADSLRRLFRHRSNVNVVDNEKIFREAVSRDGYETYFADKFAGYFGHLKLPGNRLLARNIALEISEVILGPQREFNCLSMNTLLNIKQTP